MKHFFRGERDAVLSNSGQPVHQSGPGLNGPTLSPTSERNPEARPPVQPKTGRGLGQSPRGCEAALPPFLDQLEINRNTIGRGKHCGRFSIRGRDEKTGSTTFRRVNCKCWDCPYCGPRKAKRYKHSIRDTAETLKLRRFVSLTLDPKKIEGDAVLYLNGVFAKLRTYLKRQYGVAPTYIRVLEFQKNGNPHFHLLIDRYVRREWLKEAWQSVGGGEQVDIRHIDVHRISRYLSKYLTKELFLSAPTRCRRVTTSRGIHLSEKPRSETKWDFLRLPIVLLYKRYSALVFSFTLDDESALESFSIPQEGAT